CMTRTAVSLSSAWAPPRLVAGSPERRRVESCWATRPRWSSTSTARRRRLRGSPLSDGTSRSSTSITTVASCGRRRKRTEVDFLGQTIQPVRGMNDVLPAEIGAWQHLEATARELLDAYGYEELRVPVVERTELF